MKNAPRSLLGKRYHVAFLGKIVDACNARTVKRLEYFVIDWTLDGFSGVGSPWDEPGAILGPGLLGGSPGNSIFNPPRELGPK